MVYLATVLTLLQVGLITLTSACSTTPCACRVGFTKASGPNGHYCFKRNTNRLTYTAAKARCIAGNATLPLVESADELEYYTDELGDGAQWVQAEYLRGFWGKAWKNWDGDNIGVGKLWHDPPGKDDDEPGKEDEVGYIENGAFYGAQRNETMRFICEYNIEDECAAYESSQMTKFTFRGEESVARVTVSSTYDPTEVSNYELANMFDSDRNTLWVGRKENGGDRVTIRFEDTFTLQKIDIFRRRDCCQDRYKGMEVLIKQKGRLIFFVLIWLLSKLETIFDQQNAIGKTIDEKITDEVDGAPYLTGNDPIRFRYDDIAVDEIQIRFTESYGQIAELGIDLLV